MSTEKNTPLPDRQREDKIKSGKDGRIVFLSLLAFFATFASVDAFFVYMANKTHTGVVTENAYKKGLAYNRTVADANAQAKLGWSGILSLSDDNVLGYKAFTAGGAPLAHAKVWAEVTRPTQSGKDFTVILTEGGEGEYSSAVSFPLNGQWDVRVFMEKDGKTFQTGKRIVVQ